MRTFITLAVLFTFISFVNSAWFCKDDKCSEPLYETKIYHYRPPKDPDEIYVEKGDKILVYADSEHHNYCLVKKKKEDKKFSKLPKTLLKNPSSRKGGVPISESYVKQLFSENVVNSSNGVESFRQSVSQYSCEKLNIFLQIANKICPCKNNTQSINYSKSNIQESTSSIRTTGGEVSKDENINTTETIMSGEVFQTTDNITKDEYNKTTETTVPPEKDSPADKVSKNENINTTETIMSGVFQTTDNITKDENNKTTETTVPPEKDSPADKISKNENIETNKTVVSSDEGASATDKTIKDENIETNKTMTSSDESSPTDDVTIEVDGEDNTTTGNASLKEAEPDTESTVVLENGAVPNNYSSDIAEEEYRKIKPDPRMPNLTKVVKPDFDAQIIDEEIEINETLNYDIQKISSHPAKEHEKIKNANMSTSGHEKRQPEKNASAYQESVDETISSILKDKAKVNILEIPGKLESVNKNENMSTNILEVDIKIKSNILDESGSATSPAQTEAPQVSKIPDVESETIKSFDKKKTEHPAVAEKESAASFNSLHNDETVYEKSKPEYVPTDDTVQKPIAQPSSPTPIFAPQGNSNSEELNDFGDGSPKNMASYPEKDTNVYTIIRNQEKLKEEISFHTTTRDQKEEPFYTHFFEYIPSFSTIFRGIGSPESYFNLNWLPKRSSLWENQNCDAEDNYECSNVNNGFVFGSSKIDIPFWGPVEGIFIAIYVGVFISVSLLVTFISNLISTSKQNKRVNSLIALINKLEKKLLVATKEIAILEENAANIKAQQTYEELPTVQTDETNCKVFEEQITQLELRNNELEDKVMYLEKELESVSTSALEMHTLLENSLATQVNSKTTENEVDVLRTLTETQENKIEELRNEMESILIENQCLKEDNEQLKTSLKKLEGECNNQIKKNLEFSEKNRNLTLQLDRQIESNSSVESNYKSEIYQLRSKLDDMTMNLKRAEFQVEELNRVNGTNFLDKFEGKTNDELRILYDGSQLKIQISTLEAMNNDLTAQLKEEKNARRMLDEHIGDVIKELNNLKKNFEISEKEKNEAVTKLNVLTDYFKDKETKLHKELEIKEKMFVECEGKDQLLSQKLSSLKDEINNYKIRNENLEKEILDQERSYKSQLANAEQKTREHWFELRQMERKYKETEKEAASLRNKLLILERQKSNEKANIINGDMAAIPMYPPPISPDLLPYAAPPDFIPPPPSPIASHPMEFFPPEPLYSPDERLSPLGGRRVPTPPFLMPNDDFTPPPPDSKYMSGRNRNEPPVPSSYLRTSNVSSRHRPQFQSRQQRNSLDSPSSGMSLESLDRTGR